MRSAAMLLAVALAVGCTTGRDLWPYERLDPYSAVNTTIMAEPWVYSRDVPAIAANARDYVNVGAVETNRAGLRGYWLGVVAWSTVDRSALSIRVPQVKPGKVQFNWPDDSLVLEPVATSRKALGASEPIFAGPQPVFQEAWYLLSAAQLARLGREPPSSISLMRDDGPPLVYEPWQVERKAMDQFLEATGFTTRTR
jgi:hypothetical protein